jgi:hypothetical protein
MVYPYYRRPDGRVTMDRLSTKSIAADNGLYFWRKDLKIGTFDDQAAQLETDFFRPLDDAAKPSQEETTTSG